MQPKSPSPDYDFILKDNPGAGHKFTWSHVHGRTKITLLVIAAVIILIIIYSVLSGNKGSNWLPFEGAMARGNETLRVTKLVEQPPLGLHDPQTQALAATADSVLTSDQQQISSYLSKNHVKVSAAQLATDIDKTTDASLQTAAQNNGLDSAYVTYLRNALTKYQTDLKNALPGAGPNGKKLLSDSIESTRALLNSAPIKS